MEFEAVDEGTIAKILVPEGTDEVKVGTVIALIAGEGEEARRAAPRRRRRSRSRRTAARPAPAPPAGRAPPRARPAGINSVQHRGGPRPKRPGDRVKASPSPAASPSSTASTSPASPARAQAAGSSRRMSTAPREARRRPPGSGRGRRRSARRSGVRRARKSRMRRQALQHAQDDRPAPHRIEQNVPHIYLTVDIQLDALLKLRGELNASLETAESSSRSTI